MTGYSATSSRSGCDVFINFNAQDRGVKKEFKNIATEMHKYEKGSKKAATESKKLGTSMSRMSKDTKKAKEHLVDMRIATTGIRQALGRLRNQLLVVIFAYHTFIVSMQRFVEASNKMEAAMTGLGAVAEKVGVTKLTAMAKAEKLTENGLLTVTEAAAGLKNLLSTGIGIKQAVQVMEMFTNSAAFNRQGTLKLGEAIVGATQGFKNFRSITLDNAGILTNVSVMWDRYAKQLGKGRGALSDTEKYQAMVNGIMKEGAIYMGDAARLAEMFQGKQARLNKTLFEFKAMIGMGLRPLFSEFMDIISNVAAKFMDWYKINEKIINQQFTKFSKDLAGIVKFLGGTLGSLVISLAKLTYDLQEVIAIWVTYRITLLSVTLATKLFTKASINLHAMLTGRLAIAARATDIAMLKLNRTMLVAKPIIAAVVLILAGLYLGYKRLAEMNKNLVQSTEDLLNIDKKLINSLRTKKEEFIENHKKMKDLADATLEYNTRITELNRSIKELSIAQATAKFEDTLQELVKSDIANLERGGFAGAFEDIFEFVGAENFMVNLTSALNPAKMQQIAHQYQKTLKTMGEENKKALDKTRRDWLDFLNRTRNVETLSKEQGQERLRLTKDLITLVKREAKLKEAILYLDRMAVAIEEKNEFYRNNATKNTKKYLILMERLRDIREKYGASAVVDFIEEGQTLEKTVVEAMNRIEKLRLKYGELSNFPATFKFTPADLNDVIKKFDTAYNKIISMDKRTPEKKLASALLNVEEYKKRAKELKEAHRKTNNDLESIELDSMRRIKEGREALTSYVGEQFEKYLEMHSSMQQKLMGREFKFIKAREKDEQKINNAISKYTQERLHSYETTYNKTLEMARSFGEKQGFTAEETQRLITWIEAKYTEERLDMRAKEASAKIKISEREMEARRSVERRFNNFHEATLDSRAELYREWYSFLNGMNERALEKEKLQLKNERTELLNIEGATLEQRIQANRDYFEQLHNAEQEFRMNSALGWMDYFSNLMGGWQNLGATIYEATAGVRQTEREKFNELKEMYNEGLITAETFEQKRLELSRAANEESAKVWKQFGRSIVVVLMQSLGEMMVKQGMAIIFGNRARQIAAQAEAKYFASEAVTWATIAAAHYSAGDIAGGASASAVSGAYKVAGAKSLASATAINAGSTAAGVGLIAAGAAMQAGAGFVGAGGAGGGGFGGYEAPTGATGEGGRTLGSVVSARKMDITIAPVTHIVVEDGVLVIGNDASIETLEGTLDELIVNRVKEGLNNGEIRA